MAVEDPFGSADRVLGDLTGVRHFDPECAAPGLVLFHTAVGNRLHVLDWSGRVIQTLATAPSGYSLYRPGKAAGDGSIVCILVSAKSRRDRCVASLDRNGDIQWKTSHHWLTHDFSVKGSGSIWSVIRRDIIIGNRANLRISDNVLLEMNREGEILWEWSLFEHLRRFQNGDFILEMMMKHRNDNPFHVNSIDIADYQCSYDRFGQDVIVVSSRNMNKVFFVGRDHGELLFELDGVTIGQHHARLLPETFENGAGRLIVFDNGHNFFPEGGSRSYSRIIEVDLDTSEIVWEYKSSPEQPHFFSPIVGSQQRLPDGNTVITEGYYGRVFEVDRDGQIVWDYTFPDANPVTTKGIAQTGLRQIYRAYKLSPEWGRE